MKPSASVENLTAAPIDTDKKIVYLNTGLELSHVDERSHEESRMGDQSSMFGE
jgi:hypothetical protein